jgi:hypothetical protein
MSELLLFDVPCYALAHKECDDPIELARSLVAFEFGNMGRCVLLFRELRTAVDAGKALGHEFVIEIGNEPLLELILDAEIGNGSSCVAIDFVRTADGQTAVQFRSIVQMLAYLRRDASGG